MIVDLGCGKAKAQGAIGIDKNPDSDADHVVDLSVDPIPLPDNSADEVRSNHFLEHPRNLDHIIREMHRVLKKPGGQLSFRIPYVQRQTAFYPGHVRYVGEKYFEGNWVFQAHFEEIEFEYEYDEKLVAEARSFLPEASEEFLRAVLWNVCTNMVVRAKPRMRVLSREDTYDVVGI